MKRALFGRLSLYTHPVLSPSPPPILKPNFNIITFPFVSPPSASSPKLLRFHSSENDNSNRGQNPSHPAPAPESNPSPKPRAPQAISLRCLTEAQKKQLLAGVDGVSSKDSVQNLKAQNHHQDSVMPCILGKLAMKLVSRKVKENISPPCAMSFSTSIHSVAPLNSQSKWNNDRPMNSEFQWNTSRPINSELEFNRPINSELELNKDGRINSESGWNNNRSVGWNNNRPMNNLSGWGNRPMNFESGNDTNRSMNFVRGILEENGRGMIGVPQQPRYTLEQNADIVHIKILRNNCFVTLTDSNGNRKVGASSGSLKDKAEDKSKVAKVSGYAAEATAEHIGRLAKEIKLKSVVVKGCITSPISTAITLTTMTLSEDRAKTTQINIVGGIHIRMAPAVPTGILYGRDAAGCFILSRIKAMNSRIIPKQYRKFSAATIS
ncbi:hypothetical protein RJ640_024544 [Escallonia rubra]|uniref:Ribosomal protein S11 n=1 Tax=Escallonia rubra TaxID=112253 RepID=A0AA88RJZ9_9ASTE|nr:hypothetical protein RJ640_024544 [Escallonia rubra]